MTSKLSPSSSSDVSFFSCLIFWIRGNQCYFSQGCESGSVPVLIHSSSCYSSVKKGLRKMPFLLVFEFFLWRTLTCNLVKMPDPEPWLRTRRLSFHTMMQKACWAWLFSFDGIAILCNAKKDMWAPQASPLTVLMYRYPQYLRLAPILFRLSVICSTVY